MNYDIHIENLGAIKEADITITPMTILAGENGTGKSFVTKFLYSVFKSLSKDLYWLDLTITTIGIRKNLDKFIDEEALSEEEYKYLHQFQNAIENIFNFIGQNNFRNSPSELKQLYNDLSTCLVDYNETILARLSMKEEATQQTSKNNLFSSSYDIAKNILNDAEILEIYLKSPQDSYRYLFQRDVKNELKENFQISEVKSLIEFHSDSCLFAIRNYVSIEIFKDNTIEANLKSSFSISNLIFFESPVYWKLLPIIPAQGLGGRFLVNKFVHSETLTGVPRHFLDLKDLLFTNFKDGERPEFIIECANKLQKQLKGKFNASNGDLAFENEKGQSISKNLISFGMTNIGIIQAVLSKNIINKGSFVFIDEPESNLHPEWQAILANVLVHLAKNGVYVIVTTHSSDMLKAFDISTQEQDVNEELSTYYFKSDGKLLDMIDDNFTPVEMARRKLLETYEELMMRGYLL